MKKLIYFSSKKEFYNLKFLSNIQVLMILFICFFSNTLFSQQVLPQTHPVSYYENITTSTWPGFDSNIVYFDEVNGDLFTTNPLKPFKNNIDLSSSINMKRLIWNCANATDDFALINVKYKFTLTKK
ncbi:hypothetical protein [Flavobacterium urocaniciphilum]|uniref:Uncharacterized protein n=1 Tax=Flavobacterium urocaniciphilum TaxID=1299341 RepID=A0A1H8ZQI6_9FLAO|nr:hypothetical protein [Flavobacterium urocaniciphilum]SEP66557.1 hypothetical protein SAMN05444005_101837 [Flavobacterium urocaniciphilum]